MGLSNFQRGCLGEQRTYRIGASPSFTETFLLPLLSTRSTVATGIRYSVEALPDEVIEQRLHELMLDFGIVTSSTLSRPLQSRKLLTWNLRLFVARKSPPLDVRTIVRALKEKRIAFSLAAEVPAPCFALLAERGPSLICNNFLEAKSMLAREGLATLLPDFFATALPERDCFAVALPLDRLTPRITLRNGIKKRAKVLHYNLAWNPRLLRLNPQAARQLDWLHQALRHSG